MLLSGRPPRPGPVYGNPQEGRSLASVRSREAGRPHQDCPGRQDSCRQVEANVIHSRAGNAMVCRLDRR